MKNQKSQKRSKESLFERAFLDQATDIYSRWRYFKERAKASLPKPGKGYQRERKEYLDFKNTNWNETKLLNNLFFKRFPQPQPISLPNEERVVFRLFLDYY